MMSETSLSVGVCGGGAVTNLFLPKGAGMILFYADEPSKWDHNYPARLDWDYFNNQGYARVHWLPISTMGTEEGLAAFTNIVRSEIEIISRN